MSPELPSNSPTEEALVGAVGGREKLQKESLTTTDLLQSLVKRVKLLETRKNTEIQHQGRRQGEQRGRYKGNRQRREEAGEDQSPVVCYRCGRDGHYARRCAARKVTVRETPNPPPPPPLLRTKRGRVANDMRSINYPHFLQPSPLRTRRTRVIQARSTTLHFTSFQVAGKLNNTPPSFDVDTGAAVTLISRELWDKAGTQGWHGIGGGQRNSKDHLRICSCGTLAQASFPMRVIVVERITTEAILGMDFLTANDCTIHAGKKLEFPSLGVSVPLTSHIPTTKRVTAKPGVFLAEMVNIPPTSKLEVIATANVDPHQDWILEGEQREKLPIMMARAVVRPIEGRMPVCTQGRRLSLSIREQESPTWR